MLRICLDKINLLEVYNGLLEARRADPTLGVDAAIKHLEQQHSAILSHNESFLQMERALQQRVASRPQVTTV